MRGVLFGGLETRGLGLRLRSVLQVARSLWGCQTVPISQPGCWSDFQDHPTAGGSGMGIL